MLVDWVIKNLMEIPENDDSNKSRWTRYYIEVCFVGFFNLVKVCLFSILFQTVLETFIVYLILVFLRPTAGGWHAKSKILCNLETIFFYVLFPFLLNYTHMEYSIFIKLLVAFVLIIIFSLYAPQGTEIEPVKEENRLELKMRSLIRLVILLILFFILPNDLAQNILYGLIIQAILIIPISKKIIEGCALIEKKERLA